LWLRRSSPRAEDSLKEILLLRWRRSNWLRTLHRALCFPSHLAACIRFWLDLRLRTGACHLNLARLGVG
jgi:hypothetical protein